MILSLCVSAFAHSLSVVRERVLGKEYSNYHSPQKT